VRGTQTGKPSSLSLPETYHKYFYAATISPELSIPDSSNPPTKNTKCSNTRKPFSLAASLTKNSGYKAGGRQQLANSKLLCLLRASGAGDQKKNLLHKEDINIHKGDQKIILKISNRGSRYSDEESEPPGKKTYETGNRIESRYPTSPATPG